MIKILLFLKQRIWLLSLIASVPIASAGSLVGGYFWGRSYSRDVIAEHGHLKDELESTKKSYVELRKDYESVDHDRANVLVQTKRLILDRNRLLDVEEEYKKLSDTHKASVRQDLKLKRDLEQLTKRHQQVQMKLQETQSKALELDSAIKREADMNRALEKELRVKEKALAEKIEQAPLVLQLRTELKQLGEEKANFDRTQKERVKTIEKLEKRLNKMEAYKEKYENSRREIKQHKKDNKQLSRELQNAPKRFKEMAHQNKILIKETADMHYNLGVFYAENKRFDRALAEFEKAVDLDPLHSKAHYNLGYIYSSHYENHKLAEEHFRKYLGIAPADEGGDWVRNYLVTREAYDAKVLKA